MGEMKIDELIVRMRLEAVGGVHVTVGVFAGRDEIHLAKCGTVIFSIEEWKALREGKGKFQVKMLEQMPVMFPWSIANYPASSLHYDFLEYAEHGNYYKEE